MEDDKFKLNKSNIIMIVITSVLLILVIVFSVLLIISFSDDNDSLPYLEVTEGRTSTKHPSTSTTTTTTTTTQTTTRVLNSPYYNVNMDNYLSNELFTRQQLTRDELKLVITDLYEFANKFYNIADNSLLDIQTTVNFAKANEVDRVVKDETRYGIIYNYSVIVNKAFTENAKLNLSRYKSNGKKIFLETNNNYYRLENNLGDISIVLNDLNLGNIASDYAEANLTYYKSNYREEGYSTPVYKKVNIKVKYENGRWKINEYKYPLYD